MKAPHARSRRPDPRVMPTTASTGTSEMAMATPARMLLTSRRTRANEPATPTVVATARSSNVGAVRPMICGLTSTGMRLTVNAPIRTPMRMFTATPSTRSKRDANRSRRDPVTVASGATIMAPITAGVESPMTPPEAMMLARTSSTQNWDVLARRAPVVRDRPSSMPSSGLRFSPPASIDLASQPTAPPLQFGVADSRGRGCTAGGTASACACARTLSLRIVGGLRHIPEGAAWKPT